MTRLAMLLLALAILTHPRPLVLVLAVLAAAGAVAWFAVWSYRADPPVWYVPPMWSGRFA
jgi:hypothetical protein